ncbi:Prophage LambdaMc01, tail tape measure protein [Sphingobium herbicidovorans NBRC 16415]|uniref:Prophage LambdaMc01, tail tape measure protein n=1 Tax=Sphingobium herbicidovorans (strain ATCC 700291 / DSM 11019 / CCUG 56400 / KCTC 2939 / LMG 18315 / NBRC 16415 / MH) TaxID=1219045 RepID=A0A086PBG1_SPHHM|nr:tape measure protein [Sphingobium herbicidovorans]KFG90729.1 Prophage LambdaMc01, tail tape measure protein [Sphingobium herbicidovorans NBRC 16415]
MARSVIGALRVTLGLDSAEFETGIKRASKSTQQFSRSAKEVASASTLISTALQGIGAALGIGSVTAAGAAYLRLADQSKQLAAQLKLATAQFGSFGQAQEDVNRIASTTRNGLAETGSLYANFIRATKELGGQQWEAARATETFSKTLKISGAGQAEAASATLQFGQALASGVLRGDEFNSIMESSPRLARLLADSLGVPIGSLRKMAEEGELTADRLFRALTDRKFTDGIDAEFRQMPVTFDEAMGQVRNAAITAFGDFDRGGQFSTAISNFVTDGAQGFDDMGSAAERWGIALRQELNTVQQAAMPVLDTLKEIRQWMVWAQNLNPERAKISPEGMASGLDFATGLWRRPQAFGRGIYSAATGGTFRQGFDDFMNSTSAAALVRQTQGNISNANAKATLDRILQGNPLRDAKKTPSVLKPAAVAADDKASKKAAREAEAARKRAQHEAERAADALRRFTDDFAREQSDLTTTLADLTGTIEARRDADLQQIETDRQVRERSINADDQIDAAKKQQLIEINNQNADARKRLARQRAQDEIDQRTIRREQDRADLAVELMQLSADAARTAQERRAVELRILETQFDVERRMLEIEAASSDLETATRARARLMALPALQSGARDQVTRQTQGPLEAYLDRLPRSADEAREALERVQVDGIEGVVNGLADAATGARSLGDVFKQVTNQIIADLIRIQLQKAIVGGISSVLGGVLGGGNPLAGSLDTASANIAGLAANVGKTPFTDLPAFNTGGSFRVGGMPGIDKNVVAFKASRGEMVDIRRPGNDNGGRAHVEVIPSPYFEVVVDQRAAGVAAPMAVASGVQARKAAGSDVARVGRRRIPGRG